MIDNFTEKKIIKDRKRQKKARGDNRR